MSPVYYNDPARWYADENQRRDEQMRGLLNMVMAAKKFKYDQGQDEIQRGLEQGRLDQTTRANDLYEQRLATPPTPRQASALEEWMEYGKQNGYGGKTPTEWLMLYKRGEGESIDDFTKKQQIRANFDAAGKTPTMDELDKEYRGKIAAINTNFANKSWELKKSMAEQEAKVIADPLARDKEAMLQQLKARSAEMLALADADRSKEIETLNSQYADLPRVQQHILNRKSATERVMADVAAPPAPAAGVKLPPGLPTGAEFVKTDKDGNAVYRFPDGKMYIWKE